MDDQATVLPPRRAVVAGLGIGAACCSAAVVTAFVAGLTSPGDRVGYALSGLGLALVGVALPLLLRRGITRTGLTVTAEAVTRTTGDRAPARLRFADVAEVRVGWQVSPGVLGRRPVVTLLGPATDGARGVVVNGLLVAGLEPLLERVAAEVARRPEVLTSDRALYEAVMAGRPFD